MSENILFENSFKVTELNNAKYDRVSRIKAFSEGGNEVLLTLDVNTELYPINVDERMTVALALSLNLDGSKDDGKGWREIGRGEQTLADEFDYVCHGKIYRFEEGEGDNIKVYVSFGGLLLYMDGPYALLNALRIDYVYLLIKK
ncbi:DNA-directed RNA polymerases I, II, and III subunit RPABC3 [Exophiala xenobiotica]|jgi:DNA-directed RNA polymerase I, II, and III subunit RPABC3|uniref:DNA-directed RNA polymerases I, II, and III subunit RPABC3 n=1 Tax=Vermiconidia calcicola TaxID=1690605 RepID=A0AAV9QD36_9PEZI|nr:DNA-directed RNA polymerases I, II, and III subunit RPABC3 [Exophiala xenobiotica]KAK5537970.1 DNA-directed RNA polymerases I, II, and III subunit RPABC3 [Chaetothyriales sp. CCFEE 6169]KAK5539574.1 DNA-directed RNA polymerases I, II, and III subunit RPABC3 [Vermiconidia calcicola]KAK5199501.1 DNA-directed RNA polymerases I, II, and III subunit RPABC3 [Exophiala xenobiotica]KAK5210669.1 DNA-directed RNA polymerases I, II, and III subunit RPABC3 [Exophiala xenobiotica]